MHKIAELLYDTVCGTPDDVFNVIDELIERGEIDEDYFSANEADILSDLDSLMFNCAICGWNCWAADMSIKDSNMGETVCVDCGGDDES